LLILNYHVRLHKIDGVFRWSVASMRLKEKLDIFDLVCIEHYWDFRNSASARDWYDHISTFKAEVAQAEKDNIRRLVTLRLDSVLHELGEQYDKANECLTQMLDIDLELFQSLKNACCHQEIARYYELQSNINKAIEHYELALPYTEQCISKGFLFHCLRSLGTLYFQQGELEKARRVLEQCVPYGDSFLKQLLNHENKERMSFLDDGKIIIFDDMVSCHKMLSEILIQSGNHKEALLRLEHCRGRILMERLIAKSGMALDHATSEISNLHLADIESLVSVNKYSIVFYFVGSESLHTFFAEDEKVMQFSTQNLENCEKTIQLLVEQSYCDMKVSREVNCENRCLDSMLDETVTQDDDDVKEMQQHHSRRVNSRGNPPGSEGRVESNVESTLKALYQKLMGNVSIEKEEIVIIPDGPLYKVPFAALRNPDTGCYLSETKRIRFAPSLRTLQLLENCANDSYKGALIIGNPLVGKVMLQDKEINISSLPNAEAEAIAIAYRLGVGCLTRDQATKPAVLKKLREGVSIIHIAAHGFLETSTIVLAPSPEVRSKRVPVEVDYMLTMEDVQKAQVRAQLVVLSCCNSGRGKIRTEGVIGMCRAFLASGARAVVASLWSIDDDATLEFMIWFYLNLQKGYSVGTSLQMTMTDQSKKSGKYSDPRYWASFFLMGDDVTIKFK